MIFKTINAKLEKSSYNAEIKNIDLASGHWGSEKKVFEYLDEIETFSYDKSSFDKKLVLHALKLLKENPRISDMKFYRVPEENRIILLCSTKVTKFKDVDIFQREMAIALKRDKLSFSIIEILPEESEQLKKGEKTIPESWKLDEQMTDRLNKLKHYQ